MPRCCSTLIHHDLNELLLVDLSVLVEVELIDHRLSVVYEWDVGSVEKCDK